MNVVPILRSVASLCVQYAELISAHRAVPSSLTAISNLTCQNDSRATQNFYLEIRKQLSSSKYPFSSGPEGS
jgi:hypothetical protein